MIGITKRAAFLPVVLGLVAGASGRAGAELVITPTFGSSITSDSNAANIEATINQAIEIYRANIATPINVTIQFNEMTGGLGQSTATIYNVGYGTFYNKLAAGATSADDAAAVASLGGASSTNPVNGDAGINVNTANLKALGFNPSNFPSGLPGGFDGIVGLNTHLTDVGSSDTTGQFSLLATVQHEIDEVLGLGSAQPNPFRNDPSPEDLFRYSAQGVRSFPDQSGVQPYLSFDGGKTSIVQYNTNPGGDLGDYNGVGGPHVQDAFAVPGAQPTLGVEFRALDVIGYTRAVPSPEPASIVLCGIAGLMGLGYTWHRRRSSPQPRG